MNRRRSEYVIVYLTDDRIQGSARCTDNVSGKGWITIRFQSVQPRKTEVGREVGRLEAALVADPSNRPTSSNLKRQNSSTRARVCARARDGYFSFNSYSFYQSRLDEVGRLDGFKLGKAFSRPTLKKVGWTRLDG